MTKQTLDFSGDGEASNHEIEQAADMIYYILRTVFDNPKDAGAALAVVHCKFVRAAFPSDYRDKAIMSIDSHGEFVKEFTKEEFL